MASSTPPDSILNVLDRLQSPLARTVRDTLEAAFGNEFPLSPEKYPDIPPALLKQSEALLLATRLMEEAKRLQYAEVQRLRSDYGMKWKDVGALTGDVSRQSACERFGSGTLSVGRLMPASPWVTIVAALKSLPEDIERPTARTVMRWCSAGHLPSRTGSTRGRWEVRASELERFIREQKQEYLRG